MVQQPLELSSEEQIRAYKQTRMHSFILGPKEHPVIRGAILDGTLLVQQMRANHQLGILETLILGHGYLGALLMTSQLKGHDTISLSIRCEGPAEGIYVEANAFGEVRGYIRNPSIPITKPLDSQDYQEFFQTGTLEITRTLEGGKQPFSSTLELVYGNIAQDLAHYYIVSEQTPSAFHLSIRFDSKGKVIGAGGLKLQTLPGTKTTEQNDQIRQIENQMLLLPSLGSEIAHGQDPIEYVDHWFQDYTPQHLASRPVEFMCHCSEQRFLKHLQNLPLEDRIELKQKGPFPLVLTCHHCGSTYSISKNQLQELTP
jgi:molecular chaperone Hsp33